MRKLMWFTLGFSGACGISAYIGTVWGVVFGILLASGLALGIYFLRKRNVARKCAVFLLGIAAGVVWFVLYDAVYLSHGRALDGETVHTIITASDYSYDTDYGSAVDGTVELSGRTFKIRTYLDEQTSLSPGDCISGNFKLRFTAKGAAREETYHSGYGIFLLGYQRGEVRYTSALSVPVRFFPAFLSGRISDILKQYFPGDTFPFAQALLLGDTSQLSYEVDTALKLSGIRHVVAVSGLHVAILFSIIGFLTMKNRIVSALVSIPVLAAFAAVAGFTPSVTRACIMSEVMVLGRLFDREYDSATALSFSVFLMTLINPMVLTAVGFQLSVASVAGIYLCMDNIRGGLVSFLSGKSGRKPDSKILDWVISSVSVSLSASVLTTPLCAYYFGVVSLIGLVTNLLTLWVITFLFCGLIGVCLLSFVWSGGAFLAAKILSIPIRGILHCARILSRFPLAAVYTRSPYIVIWLAVTYFLMFVWIYRKREWQSLILYSGACLMIALSVSWVSPMMGNVTMTVLDVGQGQSILLHSDGKTILVDCGGDSETKTADMVAQELASQGISRLDAVIVTHCDKDHVSGLENLLSRVTADAIFVPVQEADRLPSGVRRTIVSRDTKIEYGKTSIMLYPSFTEGSGNEMSMCVLFERESCAILITGDRDQFGERLLMKHTSLPQVDILVAGHHGSGTATGEELLETVKPEIVVVSVGENNRYGHPDSELLHRLTQHGCRIYRTDLSGTITIRR